SSFTQARLSYDWPATASAVRVTRDWRADAHFTTASVPPAVENISAVAMRWMESNCWPNPVQIAAWQSTSRAGGREGLSRQQRWPPHEGRRGVPIATQPCSRQRPVPTRETGCGYLVYRLRSRG